MEKSLLNKLLKNNEKSYSFILLAGFLFSSCATTSKKCDGNKKLNQVCVKLILFNACIPYIIFGSFAIIVVFCFVTGCVKLIFERIGVYLHLYLGV